MDYNWIWKAALIVIAGSMLLRIVGRKSISQLTVAKTVIMISIGSLIIQPVSGVNIWVALIVAPIIVITLVIVELLEVQWDWMENLFTGKAVVVIQDGEIVESPHLPGRPASLNKTPSVGTSEKEGLFPPRIEYNGKYHVPIWAFL